MFSMAADLTDQQEQKKKLAKAARDKKQQVQQDQPTFMQKSAPKKDGFANLYN